MESNKDRKRCFETRVKRIKCWVAPATLAKLEALLTMIQEPSKGLGAFVDEYQRELDALYLAGYTQSATYDGTTLFRGPGGYVIHDYFDGLRNSVADKPWWTE